MTKTIFKTILVSSLLSLSIFAHPKDSSLEQDQEIKNLIRSMTLKEKVSQLIDDAPEIQRLGIPKYHWWNEALHGVARAGLATVFPQAIGLAATWNTTLMYQVASAISDEGRAKHHESLRQGGRDQYMGLTFWSPNINIFRDPRWGRGQETYGEDPYLTTEMSVNFIKGLQGDDPKFLKTAATIKHFAVHSGPETGRFSFDAKVNSYDLEETYLPAFEASVRQARPESVMCSYNRINGIPACANAFTMDKILRKTWGFDGHIVADCGAVGAIYDHHRYTQSYEKAAVEAIKAGTDLDCSSRTFLKLANAVKKGLVDEAYIDQSLFRLFQTRKKLGMMDLNFPTHPYANIPYSVVDSNKNRNLARQSARESIVLLKNDNFLPINRAYRKIAIIGPNANDRAVLLGNYNGTPSYFVTPFEGIKRAFPEADVQYAEGVSISGSGLEAIHSRFLQTVDGKIGIIAEYFDNASLSGPPKLTRNENEIDFSWDVGSPAKEIPIDRFSARFTGKILAPESGEYVIGVASDDGVRLYVNNNLLINDWNNHTRKETQTRITLIAGQSYDLKLEYYDNNADASLKLIWKRPHLNPVAEAIKLVKNSELAIVVLGLNQALETEENDRAQIELQDGQQKLLAQAYATTTPIILVILSGSPIAIPWATENIPAILQAWYPGQEGGNALADIILGDANPSGHLPVTFYKKTEDLPAFSDYNMQGRTYRYFGSDVLFPFGYGLSYSDFSYKNLVITSETISSSSPEVTISATIQNISSRSGDEVVQLYLRKQDSKHQIPLQTLKGFKKVHLEASEEKTISFDLKINDFTVVDKQGKRVVEQGEFQLWIGPHAPLSTGSFQEKANFLTTFIKLK